MCDAKKSGPPFEAVRIFSVPPWPQAKKNPGPPWCGQGTYTGKLYLDHSDLDRNPASKRFYASHNDPVQVSRRHADWVIIDHMSSTKCQSPHMLRNNNNNASSGLRNHMLNKETTVQMTISRELFIWSENRKQIRIQHKEIHMCHMLEHFKGYAFLYCCRVKMSI